jgi:hypothetical protein
MRCCSTWKLPMVFRILDGLVLEGIHDADSLGAHRQCRIVNCRSERGESFVHVAEHGVPGQAYTIQRNLGGA